MGAITCAAILCLIFSVTKALPENLIENTLCRKSFFIAPDKVNWFRAMINCKASGMELACINTEQDEANLEFAVKDLDITGRDGENGLWLGGTNLPNTNSKQYYWIDGTEALYSNWIPGEPNNGNGVEHCLELARYNANDDMGWNDKACETELRYVCQTTDCICQTTD